MLIVQRRRRVAVGAGRACGGTYRHGGCTSCGMVVRLDEFPTAEPFLPRQITLPALKKAVQGCEGCPLYKNATQAVFGEGRAHAKVMFIGEQPGDQEDLAGKPFVGPAGKLLDQVLEEVGIDRSEVYVTNAVKHFKFILRGKRRIHNKPDAGEITACRWWIEHERALIKPALTVALGVTAARSLVGKVVTISKVRDAPLTLADGSECWVTVHPSSLLRIPDEEGRREARAMFVRDLKRIKARAEKLTG